MDNFVGMFRKALCVFCKCIWTTWPLAKGVFSRIKQLDEAEQTWKWKYNAGFNWLFAETGTTLQDELEQVVRVDEINLVPELSNFFPFRRNFFCSLCLRLTDPSKPLKALCYTFYGQRLLFWMASAGIALPAQPEMWLCPGLASGVDNCGPSLQFFHPKYAQLVTPPVPISFHCFFAGFSFFLVIKV